MPDRRPAAWSAAHGRESNSAGLRFALTLAALHACAASQAGMGHFMNPLDGGPTKTYNHFCAKGDVSNDAPDVDVLNSWLDVGSDYNAQVFQLLMPIDGKYYGDKLQNHRVVAYDMRLANLADVDADNAAFKAKLQMIFSWVDQHNTSAAAPSGLSGMPVTPACSFPCDTAESECCDTVWVPQLKVSNLDSIQGSESELAELGPIVYETITTSAGNRTWQDSWGCARRGWSVTLDASFDADLDFRDFPFDSQLLNVTFFNPLYHHVHYKHLAGLLQIDGSFQDITQDVSAKGWLLREVYITRECGATPWWSFFMSQAARLANLSAGYDFARDIQHIQDSLDGLQADCTSQGGMPMEQQHWMHDFTDLTDDFLSQLNKTIQQYDACLQSHHAPVYHKDLPRGSPYGDLVPNDVLDSKTASRRVSFECLIAAVSNVTTTGFTLHIRVQRFAGFYVVKLLLPVVACVLFAFTAFGVRLEELGARLAIIVPAAVALTALQIIVVATDVPSVSYVVPTTYMMLCAYLAQLTIALETVLIYIIWLPRKDKQTDTEPLPLDKEAGEQSPSNSAVISSSTILRSLRACAGSACQPLGRSRCCRSMAALKKLETLDAALGLAVLAAYILSLVLCICIPIHRGRAATRPAGSVVLFDEGLFASTGGAPRAPMIW